ncbi:MAG: hypothetical protein RL398_1947 [Planctomycetota bacterium]|jgi:hypothetical protein
MIRGPVLPQAREKLWALVSPRLEVVEPGLRLVSAGFDCSEGQLGAIEGLARDAAGAPVLVLVAAEGDGLLAARVCAALDFLERVGPALAAAVPEGCFVPNLRARVLVIASAAAHGALAGLHRISAACLQACILEPFRLGTEERFAVRWTLASVGATPDLEESPEFAVPASGKQAWSTLQRLFERLDPEVRVGGGRFTRRVTWRGRLLAELQVADESLSGVDANGLVATLGSPAEVRAFADRILRSYLAALESGSAAVKAAEPATRDEVSLPRPVGRAEARSTSPGSMRSSLAAARLSPEEFSALGGGVEAPTTGAGGAARTDAVRPPGAVSD